MVHFDLVPRRMALSFSMTLVYLIHLLDVTLRCVLSLYNRQSKECLGDLVDLER